MRFKLASLVLLLLAVWLLARVSQEKPFFRVIFFDVGQGDSALIQFDNGAKMLVDCGAGRAVLPKLGKYLPFYDRTIDYLVITHPDMDHYGGCTEVLKRYNVKNVFTNGVDKDNEDYWLIWKKYLLSEKAIEKKIYAPESMEQGSAKIEFLSPNASSGWPQVKGDNNYSVVFRLTQATTSFLFVGDLESAGEELIMSRYCASTTPCASLDSGYLKVGHHGSGSSSDDDFLAIVTPKIGIISVGKNNYGHPSLRTINKLERIGAQVWRTDELGDIIVR